MQGIKHIIILEETNENIVAEKILKKYKNQLKRLKKYAIISWIIIAIYALGAHNLKVYFLNINYEGYLTKDEFWFLRYLDMGLVVLILASIPITYLVYQKSKTLTMLQICARLSNIEQYLIKLSPDK